MSVHRFYANYIYVLPMGRGKALSTAWAGGLGWLFEGWRISGITTLESGRPFTPVLPGDPNNDGLTSDRPDRVGAGNLPRSRRSIDQWFATSDFARPAPFTFGNAGRNILFGPAERRWDISIIKQSKLSNDGDLIDFRVQLFNAFNNTSFHRPNATFGTSTFGRIFGAEDGRTIEVALKYTF